MELFFSSRILLPQARWKKREGGEQSKWVGSATSWADRCDRKFSALKWPATAATTLARTLLFALVRKAANAVYISSIKPRHRAQRDKLCLSFYEEDRPGYSAELTGEIRAGSKGSYFFPDRNQLPERILIDSRNRSIIMTCQQNNCRCIQLGPTFLRFWRHDFFLNRLTQEIDQSRGPVNRNSCRCDQLEPRVLTS